VPVVFMSAGLRAQTEAQQHGAAGHLAKPFDLEELRDQVVLQCGPGPA
jgi:CheY-like chemotaxis protein